MLLRKDAMPVQAADQQLSVPVVVGFAFDANVGIQARYVCRQKVET